MLVEAKQEIDKLEKENFDLRQQVKSIRISYEKEIDEYSEVNILLVKTLIKYKQVSEIYEYPESIFN